jgi:hypothetical protein
MSSVGPDLPPHLLAKRKRQAEEEKQKEATKAPQVREESPNAEKRRRVLGPALPPAPLSELPKEPVDGDDSSSDDDYGPSIPTGDQPIVVRCIFHFHVVAQLTRLDTSAR